MAPISMTLSDLKSYFKCVKRF